MLPRISPDVTVNSLYLDYLKNLRETEFSGEIKTDYATRLALATDNSIYQVIPEAVIFPKTSKDISITLKLANQVQFYDIKFCPRGGGTSPNGQSLSAGIIIDCSKYMRNILELNLKEGWVKVQAGIVLDQLNDFLKPHGVSFPQEISPSNRATIGGMVNTDACGMGSGLLGRTSDHVLDLTCVLSNGQVIQSSALDRDEPLYEDLVAIIRPHQDLINEKFTSTPRTLNGYNLKKMSVAKAGKIRLDLNYLFCGSEGTLGIVSECKLQLTPLPKYRKLLVVKYRNFDDALRAADTLKEVTPLAMEAIDERLIDLARKDPIYFQIRDFIENAVNNDEKVEKTGAINLVEFVSNNKAKIEAEVNKYCKILNKLKDFPSQAIGYYVTQNSTEAKLLWDLRKKSVGLISKKQDGTRRPIPFIEDTAVPPEKLADYISELTALLDQYQLMYGMYGHIDAGCVHVRPALDMKIIQDEKLIRELSDKVVALVEKFGGVLWGEHGKGYRSEYAPRFFGETLYYAVRRIKTLFDPYNQLNPGKIAVSLVNGDVELVSLEGPMRGQFDRKIPEAWRTEFSSTIACNGNGACFSYASAEAMCPSYKVTKDRIQSPKGRAMLMREWLRQLANKNYVLNVNKRGNVFSKLINAIKKQPDFSKEVYTAMSGCLSCKACAGQCPLNVDVPEFKAKFLAYYHQRYLRPVRDYCIASLEKWALFQADLPRLINWLFQRKLVRFILRHTIKIIDPPLISTLPIKNELAKRQALYFDVSLLADLPADQKANSVILLQDTFTSFYEPKVLLDIFDFLTKLGFSVSIAPFFASGKPLHVKGFLRKFEQLVKQNAIRLREFAQLNIPLIGIDPSITLTYRDEYQKVLGAPQFSVQLLQEWLSQKLVARPDLKKVANEKLKDFYLLSHCTEKTLNVESEKQWQTIFAAFGLTLTPLPAGCCGMSGSYGHEAENVESSRLLFNMDWQRYLKENPDAILSTGYSCRSQAKRLMGVQLQHPIEALKQILN